jgi:hypothetical protein
MLNYTLTVFNIRGIPYIYSLERGNSQKLLSTHWPSQQSVSTPSPDSSLPRSMIRRSHRKSRQGCAQCKQSHKKVCKGRNHSFTFLNVDHEIPMLISILRSATSLIRRVSIAQFPRNNVPMATVLVVKVRAIGTSFYLQGPMT